MADDLSSYLDELEVKKKKVNRWRAGLYFLALELPILLIPIGFTLGFLALFPAVGIAGVVGGVFFLVAAVLATGFLMALKISDYEHSNRTIVTIYAIAAAAFFTIMIIAMATGTAPLLMGGLGFVMGAGLVAMLTPFALYLAAKWAPKSAIVSTQPTATPEPTTAARLSLKSVDSRTLKKGTEKAAKPENEGEIATTEKGKGATEGKTPTA